MQAQPNKVRVEGKSEEKYMEKLLGKAKAIVESANRIWRTASKTFRDFLGSRYGLTSLAEIELQQELEEE